MVYHNQNYFVDNDEGGKTQIVDYQNGDPNSISGASDKHDLFEFSDASPNVDDQVYPFEYQDGSTSMDGT